MKVKYFFEVGLVAGGFAAAVLAPAGCGSSSGTGGTGASSSATNASSATTSTTHASSSTTVTTGAGGEGGAGGSGSGGAPTPNTTAAMAQMLTVNGPAFTGVAQGATGSDYYQFTATAGERIYIAANAVSIIDPAPSSDENDILDTVVTLFSVSGFTMTVVAQDDDGWPRSNSDSQLFYDVPAAGTYVYTVQSCASAFGANACGLEAPTDFIYQTFVADVGKLVGTKEGTLTYTITEFYAGKSQNGTTADAVPITYTVTKDEVGVAAVDGDSFSASANTHVFSFTVRAGLSPTAGTGGRLRTEFWLQPIGTDNGDGSTGNVTAWITDTTGTTILAQADQANYKDGDNFTDGPLDLSVPVTAGDAYYVFVKDDNAAPAAGDDYFFVHTLDTGNPLQVSGGGNTSAGNAQVLTVSTDQPGDYFVDGNIGAPSTTYWYEVDPTAKATSVSATCSSLRSGSGVQGLTLDLQAQVGATGTPATIIPTGTATTELANADLSVPPATAANGLPIPPGTTKMFLVVSATGQSATVTDTSYQCAVFYTM